MCSFVSDKLGIDIFSHRIDEVAVRYLIDEAEIDKIMRNDSVTKLFYQKSTNYAGNTSNWGNAKGLDHLQEVCVVLNPMTHKAFENKELGNLNPTTMNKPYVSFTRANRNLNFVSEKSLKQYNK